MMTPCYLSVPGFRVAAGRAYMGVNCVLPLAESLNLPDERRTNLLQVAQDYENRKGQAGARTTYRQQD